MQDERRSGADRNFNAIDRDAPAEKERRLRELIEREIAKPDAERDVAFLVACQRELQQLTYPEEPLEAHRERNWAAIERRYAAWQRKRRHTRRAVQIGAAAAAVVLLTAGAGGLRWSWLSGFSTEDAQQYVVSGHEISVDMIRKALAGYEHTTSFAVDAPGAFAGYLGFEPGIPARLSEEIVWSKGSVAFSAQAIRVGATYHQRSNNIVSINYNIYYCIDLESTYLLFEQEESGSHRTIGGQDVYVVANLNDYAAVWRQGTVLHQLSGCQTEEQAYAFVSTIIQEMAR